MMNRLNLEMTVIQNIRLLPDDKLLEVLDFAEFLKSRLSASTVQNKPSFVEMIRQSPLVELEIERDQFVCRTVDL
ncbi:MAG: hypothetical protein RL368_1452 [Pseudomonadota bacterium]|jgi:hypothetical protein